MLLSAHNNITCCCVGETDASLWLQGAGCLSVVKPAAASRRALRFVNPVMAPSCRCGSSCTRQELSQLVGGGAGGRLATHSRYGST